ncbi:metallophosphoesterase family protein [Planococcus lenghuensis]|nr:metallophosphoesterase family protein [Planococcus lenghuensis]
MEYFIVGDVHGCYFTFRQMLDRYWNPGKEFLILIGDLVDRGNHAPETVELARSLTETLPGQVVIVKGNHDFEMTEHFRSPPNYNWLRQGGTGTIGQYAAAGRDIEQDVAWIRRLPLFWENDVLFVSHAGIAKHAQDPFNEGTAEGILWNRSQLKNLGKMQVVGHTPQEKPGFDPQSNAWYIDTGAVYGRYLTGLKVSAGGEVKELVHIETDERDIDR